MASSSARKLTKVAPAERAPESETRAAAGLHAVRALRKTDDGVLVAVGSSEVLARVDDGVHPAVVEGALRRGERLLAESDGASLVIVGALRTQPTPGIDAADAYVIQAGSVRIEAKAVSIDGEEVALSSKTARIVLRAASEIESFAERIVTRASGVHKIVGRMLRLN